MAIGETLAEARRARGLSVEQVSERTRIRATVIRAIEADEFEICGAPVYARGHIRSIGHAVGVDAEPLIAEYDRGHGGPPAGPATLAVSTFDPQAAAAAGRSRRSSWSTAAAISLVAIIAFAAIALALGQVAPGHPPRRQRFAPVASPVASPAASPAASPVPAPSQLTVAGVSIEVRVIAADSWFSVTNSAGAVLFQGLLYAGQQRLFSDPTGLSVIIGNSPVVQLVVNGRNMGSPSVPGDVARFSCQSGEPTATCQTTVG